MCPHTRVYVAEPCVEVQAGTLTEQGGMVRRQMPGVLCHPSRRELLNWLISEAEKSQLWVRKKLAFTTASFLCTINMSPVTPPATVRSSPSGAQGASGLWLSVLAPQCVCIPGWLLNQVALLWRAQAWCRPSSSPVQCTERLGGLRPQRHCSHFTDEGAVAVKGCGQEPPFQVLGILVREHSSSRPSETEVLLSGGS